MESSPSPRWPVALMVAVAAAHIAGGLAWMDGHHVPFDGDEAGHVGAAELFAGWWRDGHVGGALVDTFAGRLGSYPPLYAGLVGAWWALTGAGDPADPAVRGINLAWLLIAAAAVARLARPLGSRAAAVGFAAVLALPLPCGLSRHFMIEGALVAAVALVVLAGEAARARPGRLALAGLALGLAFLVKQTAVIYLLPVLAFRLPRRPASLMVPFLAAVVAGPWVALNFGDQVGYGLESGAGTPGLGLLWHLAFYPWSALWVGAGPALLALALVGLAAGLRAREEGPRDRTWLAVAWFGGTLLLLLLLPRKYPRLLAPALPALGLLAAVGVAQAREGWRRWACGGLLAVGLAWTAAGSLIRLPVPAGAAVFDDRCPQVWLRPPVSDDLALGAVIAAARATRPGPVRVVGDVEIPCGVQTTHPWSEHLGPALRRAGLDREILEDDDPRTPVLVVSWEGPQEGYEGEALGVPALGASLWIGRVGP